MPNRHVNNDTKIQTLVCVFIDYEYVLAGKTILRRRRLLRYRLEAKVEAKHVATVVEEGGRKGVAEAAVEVVRGLEGEERGGVGEKAAAEHYKIY